jgi:predicted P-loop ATPase
VKKDSVLIEAKRLYNLGFAIHWLRPKSKVPLESGWTTGPRKEWKDLERTYRKGFNVGVRLGEASAFKNSFLAVIDVDVKSKDPRHRDEAIAKARELLGGAKAPVVKSGRGNGSRHYYCRTRRPVKTYDPATSTETVTVYQPSKRASRKELEKLGLEQIEKGMRLSAAWQVSVYSHGRQVVLPPSIHPDTGKEYFWGRRLESVREAPLLPLGAKAEAPGVSEGAPQKTKLRLKPVELEWLPISAKNLSLIKDSTDGDRSVAILQVAKALARVGLDEDEILTVLTDKKNKLSEVAYEHAKTTDRARAAQWLYKYTARKAVFEVNDTSEFDIPDRPKKKLTEEEQAKIAAEIAEDRDWRQDIIRNKDEKPARLINNIILILSNAVSPKVVRRDLFCTRDSYSIDTPWGAKAGDIVKDDDVDELQSWMGKHFGFEPPKNIVESGLVVIARQNSFDPVREMLSELPVWDGTSRLHSWLLKNFEADGDPEYLGQVFTKWMVAMVMRAFRPGCKFDWMPIFEGAQGIGKSSFGKLLVGDKYFLDWLPNLHDKDSALSLQGMWAVEMGELSQFRRNELETIKAFLTRTIDKIRPPFGKRLIESPRRCVFFGTTNRKKYLLDETGNRRFKPLVVGSLNFKALKAERSQLFAEALHLFKNGMTELDLELTGRAALFEKQIHQEKMVEDDSDAMEQSMRIFIEKVAKKEVNFDLKRFRILDLFDGVGPLGNWRKENRNLQFASKMLRRIGAENRMIRGLQYWKIENSTEIEDFF